MKDYCGKENNSSCCVGGYKSAQKQGRKATVKTVIVLCLICLVGMLIYAGQGCEWHSFVLKNVSDGPTYRGELNCGGEGVKKDTTGIEGETPMEVFNVISLSQGDLTEFAGDMYRPEGFSVNIGSVLAIKMSIIDDDYYKFPVIVCIPDDENLKQLVKNANSNTDTPISIAEALAVDISGEINTTNKYYYLLTANQIIALANSNAKCYYVGSGEGNYEDMNWETEAGINAYCELLGDMYVVNHNNIKSMPDIFLN